MATNTARLIASQVVLTLGELASAVCSRPWTIHGWRPISVSIQPNEAATKGRNVFTTPAQRNQRAVASRLRRYRNAPTRAIRATSEPAYAIPRMLQYIVRTGGM